MAGSGAATEVVAVGIESQCGTNGSLPGPEWQTVHGGVAMAGGALEAGAGVVVPGASQSSTRVAEVGPY